MSKRDSEKQFDIDNPVLPEWVERNALSSGDYPYDEKLDRKLYEEELTDLQKELVTLQAHLQATGERIAILFEGRDAAGKGGTIKRYTAYLNPRHNRTVALPKPSDREQGQWYFQRYVPHLPTSGETVLFDRSWYNRAGVEPVMGFCTPSQTVRFLSEAPLFEKMIVDDGIHFFKFWLNIGREMQLKRFHDRRHDELKVWKLSPIDLKSLDKWEAYTEARDTMLEATDTAHAPWHVVRANDKRRSRLNVIRTVLSALDYAGRNEKRIGNIDPNILLGAEAFLNDGHDD